MLEIKLSFVSLCGATADARRGHRLQEEDNVSHPVSLWGGSFPFVESKVWTSPLQTYSCHALKKYFFLPSRFTILQTRDVSILKLPLFFVISCWLLSNRCLFNFSYLLVSLRKCTNFLSPNFTQWPQIYTVGCFFLIFLLNITAYFFILLPQASSLAQVLYTISTFYYFCMFFWRETASSSL